MSLTAGKANVFTSESIRHHCDQLATKDRSLKKIIALYGYPKIQFRQPGFGAMVRLILEQQVSLMSAQAAWKKLLDKVGTLTPASILKLSDEELRACYFSRQKTSYARSLAKAVENEIIIFSEHSELSDIDIREQLIALKGIGDWTVDSYLLLSLNRLDIFPIGDIALVNSIRKITGKQSRKEILALADTWRPYRSIATLLFWHAYIIERGIKLD